MWLSTPQTKLAGYLPSPYQSQQTFLLSSKMTWLNNSFQTDRDSNEAGSLLSAAQTPLDSNLDSLPTQVNKASYSREGWLLRPSQKHLRPFPFTDRGERSTYRRNAGSLQNWIPLPSPAQVGACPAVSKGTGWKVHFAFPFPFAKEKKKLLINCVRAHIICGKLLSYRIWIYLMRPNFDRTHCMEKYPYS